MSTVIVFEGVVTKVERSTTGYGENERTVGIDVHVQSRWDEVDPADGAVTQYTRTSTIHLPKGFTQPMVGHQMSIVLNEVQGVPESARDEIAQLVAEEPDEDDEIQGDPYYDEIKQGG